MKSGWLRCVLVAGWLVWLAGCGSSSKSTLVYLVSQGSDPGTIATYRLNLRNGTLSSSNGALSATGKAVDTGTQPGPMIFDPSNSFLFVADFGSPVVAGSSGDIAVFSVGKDGDLTSIGLTPPTAIPGETLNPVALAIDPDGKFLFVASQAFTSGTPAAGVVSVFSVSSGTLTAQANVAIPVPAGSTNAALPSAIAVTNSETGKFVYVTDAANGTVVGFSFDDAGTLSSIPGQFVTVGNTPRAVLSPPAGTFLYVANAGTDDIYEFFVNSDGSLVPVGGSATNTTIATGVGPIAMITDPDTKYLYALANGGSQINEYKINRVTGALTAVGANGGAVSTGANPVAFTMRSDGSSSGNFWVITSNFGSNTVSTFALNGSTGALAPLPQLTAPLAPYGIGSR